MRKSIGLLLLLLLLVLLICLGTATAEEAQNDTRSEDSQLDDKTITTGGTEKPKVDAKANKNSANIENYRPSESISEDLSVSFPVDI